MSENPQTEATPGRLEYSLAWMVATLLLGFVASGVVLTLLPRFLHAQVQNTFTAAETIRGAITMYRAENFGGCPDIYDLAEGQYINSSRRVLDAWDRDFVIACKGRHVRVSSAGPDGRFGTADDIADPSTRHYWGPRHVH